MKPRLGKMSKEENLRLIWAHEAGDFSKWLAEEENLSSLGEAIGISIELDERESPVGEFSVDLFAKEEDSGRRIVIENQLESSDHDHLGKIITYASGKGAEVVVWIVKKAREEHKQAIMWLNQHTDENIGFFLVEIELWKIDDSNLAPKFNVVEKPNAWAKTMKAAENLSEIQRERAEFWRALADYFRASKKSDFAEIASLLPAAGGQGGPLFPLKKLRFDDESKCQITFMANSVKKRLGVKFAFAPGSGIFQRLRERAKEIESDFGALSEWKSAGTGKADKIFIFRNGDMKDASSWPDFFEWYCGVVAKFIRLAAEKNCGNAVFQARAAS